jgi:hypothetical protein
MSFQDFMPHGAKPNWADVMILKIFFPKKLAKKVGVFKIKAITLHMPWRHSISRL